MNTEQAATIAVGYLPLAKQIASSVHRRMPRHVDLADVRGDAVVGLVQASQRFDQSRQNGNFAAYAQRRVRGAIKDGQRRDDWAPRKLRTAANRDGVGLARIEAWPEHIDGQAFDIPDPRCVSEDEIIARLDREKRLRLIRDAMMTLDERARAMVEGHFFQSIKMARLAKDFGCAESRVSQIVAKALGKMRSYVQGKECVMREGVCVGEDCKRRAVDGMSYCSEDHYEELVEERKAKQNYRTGYLGVTLPPTRPSPVHVAAPKIPTPKPVKQPRPKAKTELSRETLPDEKLRELRAMGMSYKDIAREYGQEWAVVASRSQQLGIGASKAAAPQKEMPAQQYEDKEVEAILGQAAQLAKESSDEWRSGQDVAQGTGAIKGMPDALDCRCGHPADAHVRGHHGDSECRKAFCNCGNYDTRPDSAFISEQAAKQAIAAMTDSFQPEKQPANPYEGTPEYSKEEVARSHKLTMDAIANPPRARVAVVNPAPGNPYDAVILDLERRRDLLLDAIRLMQALRDSGV